MLEHWFVMGADELPDPPTVRRDTDAHLGTWNEHGRRLATAFLDYAGRLSATRSGAAGSADHSCHEPT